MNALEPYSESLRLALENVKMNGFDDRIEILNLSLSSVKSKIDFAVSSKNPNTNVLMPTEYVVKSLHAVFHVSIAIETTAIHQLISDYLVSRLDFHKFD